MHQTPSIEDIIEKLNNGSIAVSYHYKTNRSVSIKEDYKLKMLDIFKGIQNDFRILKNMINFECAENQSAAYIKNEHIKPIL